jgi:TPP-dependent pyruvate/acetoin dehydrogenase alpha subunit
MKPDFKPRTIECGSIRAYQYKKSLKTELAAGTIARQEAIDMLEDMLTVREFEEMIVKLRSGAYEACKGYDYRGPTHVSIGQEATSVGACIGINADDFITSTFRGHGHALAKGLTVQELLDELFGAQTGCCKGKGGSMHVGNMDKGMIPGIAIVGSRRTSLYGQSVA